MSEQHSEYLENPTEAQLTELLRKAFAGHDPETLERFATAFSAASICVSSGLDEDATHIEGDLAFYIGR